MKLWTVDSDEFYSYLSEENMQLISSTDKDFIRTIADEHNAWVISEHHGWSVKRWVNGKFGVCDSWGGCPIELTDYGTNTHGTPVAAILAADAWLRARER